LRFSPQTESYELTRLCATFRLSSARKLYQVERQKIEDEYKKSRDLVRQRLLDGLEERRRKIREDKETVNDIVAGTFGFLPRL
jgi:hypothetical protein